MQGMVINKSGSQGGLPTCANKTNLPIVQDDSEGSLWEALGVLSNSVVIVDQQGNLVQVLTGSIPGLNPMIETIVNDLLGL